MTVLIRSERMRNTPFYKMRIVRGWMFVDSRHLCYDAAGQTSSDASDCQPGVRARKTKTGDSVEARLTIRARVSYCFPSFQSTIESHTLGEVLSSSNSGAVVHRNVAVIACDTGVTLKETLHRLEDLDVDAVQIGERHLVLPARQVGAILDGLREHGQFPKLVGQSITAKEREMAEVEEKEEAEDSE